MESFFFNITDSSYKSEMLFYKDDVNYLKRVDISNGIVFLELSYGLEENCHYTFHNLDRMLAISVVQKGSVLLHDREQEQSYKLSDNSISMFLSSKQDIEIKLSKAQRTKVFTLFIADFILKRYLSKKENSVIDFLYNTLQGEISLKQVDSHSIDALSLYIIDKIKEIDVEDEMNSLECEQYILEFMIHRFKLLDIYETALSDDEICISRSAKDILLKSFVTPPTIDVLAHLCATNETKLKSIFKKRYKTTIYTYVQTLRLQKANLLLREQNMTIGEIAREVGYKHQGHFSKLFFEHYGVYPKELLKKSL
jgi:AraC-like DNA-binding protein